MRKSLLGAAAALIAFGAVAAPRADRMQSDRLFTFAPKAKAALNTTAGKLAGPMKEAASQALPKSNSSGYLNGPKGAVWFYTLEYKGETVEHPSYTEQTLTGFKLTVYNDKFQEVGTVEDDIELQEGETKIAQFSIGPDITQKFFNYDTNYEIMMGVAFNTTDYVNTYRTYAYSLGSNERIATFQGYYCSAIDTATDAWSEKFWITFMTEEETETSEVNGVLNASDYRFRTYKAAGYSGMGDPVIDTRFPSVTVSGADAIPFLANVSNGIPYFAVSHLKYSWYEDPYDYSNENPTADNQLVVDIFAPASAWGAVDKYCTTTIPMNPTADDLYFLYLGNFSYDDDLNFRINGDGTPALYITRAHTTRGGDSFIYDYEAYSTAPKGETADGQKKFTVAQGTNGGSFIADIDGFAPQVLFIDSDQDENLTFRFVNPLNGEVEHEIDPYVDPENPEVVLTSQTNRIPRNGSYVYYSPQNRGISDQEGNMKTSMVFVDPETGSIVNTDYIHMGKNVEYAQLYGGSDIFDPYIFNLDNSLEYMALVKRRASDGLVKEELMVVSADPEKGTLLSVGPDEVKGNLANVFFANLDGEMPKLVVVYQNTSDWTITLDSYDLPLVSFENGDGTIDNPYEISTVGGLKQIYTAPEAHYAVVNDIDASGYTLEQKSFDFTGSLDGRGHIISNLDLNGYALIPTMSRDPQAAEDSPNARLLNLNFLNPVFNATHDDQGLLLGHMTGGLVENVHVYGGKVTSDKSVAGLVGQSSLFGQIRDCSFQGDITSPENSVGGIVINTMTSASVRACAFKGSINGGQYVGGITAITNNNAGETADCHVNADIKGKNTVGGIVGNSARAVIRNCHVQGTLEATQAPTWGGGPKLGGIVGQLDRDYGVAGGDETGEGDVEKPEAVIQGCYVNLTSMTFSGTPEDEEYAGQNDTMHRIVGWTSINDEPEEVGYDEETWEPIYGDPAPAETALKDNYAVATLPAASEDFDNSATSSEGASVAADETGMEFFQNLGWLYGYDFENPWNMTGDQFNPSLYFEGGLLLLTPADVTVKVDEEVVLSLQLAGEELTEEMLGGFACEMSDESVAELSNMEMGADGEILLTVKGLKEGNAELTCGLNGKMTKAVIAVEKKDESGIDNVTVADNALRFDGRNVYADGCMIEVYSSTGARMLTGNGTLSLQGLQGGVYIVTAVDADGNRSSLKVSLR